MTTEPDENRQCGECPRWGSTPQCRPAIGSGLMVTAVATVYLSDAHGDGAIVRAMRCRAWDESNEAARVAGSGGSG